jgi:putative transposase
VSRNHAAATVSCQLRPPVQTLKNRILLENHYLPGDLETQIETFVADYNHLRYHESIGNLTPADVYLGGARPS